MQPLRDLDYIHSLPFLAYIPDLTNLKKGFNSEEKLKLTEND